MEETPGDTSQASGRSCPGAPYARTMTRDFSKPRSAITFTIDGDLFTAAPALPGETLVQFVSRFSGDEGTDRTPAEQLNEWREALELVLLPESYELFVSRMRDRARPIEVDQMSDVIVWLLEQYGLRPTQPSSPSVPGLDVPEPGTNSMAPVPHAGPTSVSSPLLVS